MTSEGMVARAEMLIRSPVNKARGREVGGRLHRGLLVCARRRKSAARAQRALEPRDRPFSRWSSQIDQRSESDAIEEENVKMAVHYLEIVSDDVDTLSALYQRIHLLSFGPPHPISGRPVWRLARTACWWASGNPWRRMSSRSFEPTSRSKTCNKPRVTTLSFTLLMASLRRAAGSFLAPDAG
jgi:hypothetical protein